MVHMFYHTVPQLCVWHEEVDMWPRTQSQFQGRIGPGNMEGGGEGKASGFC